MVNIEIRPAALAVVVALSGARYPEQICRFIRCRVMFPDIGSRFVEDVGFLRYSGEPSFVAPEATEQELTLLPGLTISSLRSKESWLVPIIRNILTFGN